MAKNKPKNVAILNKILQYYTIIVMVLLFGIIGSWFLYSSSAATVGFSGAVERDQASRIVASRAARGISAPRNVDCLNNLAEKWSKNMGTLGKLYHNEYSSYTKTSTNTWSIRYYCGNWLSVGENVGFTTGSNSSEVLYNAFMASPGHKANIINPAWSSMGVGAYYDSSGRLWVTQLFAKCSTCSSTKWQTRVVYPN